MGDTYTISGQAAAVGPNAKAEGNTFQQLAQHSQGLDFKQLAEELPRLLEAMKGEAKFVEHFQALAQVAEAAESAKQQDGTKLLEHLKAVGQWGLDVATKIGTRVAEQIIKNQLGL